MNYKSLIREAWATTWRYRFLWIFGILAGGVSFGGNSNWRAENGDQLSQYMSPSAQATATAFAAWVQANVGMVVVGALLFGLVGFVLGVIAEGSLVEATADVALGRPTSFLRAWDEGRHVFWRYVGMWLIVAGIAILAALAVGVLVAIGVAIGAATQSTPLIAFMALLGVVLGIALIAAGVGFSITVTYALRAIAVEEMGAFAGLGAGWALFRTHIGQSLATWGIGLALSIVVGTVLGAIAFGLAALAGGFGLFATLEISAMTILAAAVVALVGLVVAGAVNTFFWDYWTLAYLRLAHPQPVAA